MGIHFNHPTGNSRAYPISGEALRPGTAPKKNAGESASFLDLLQKVSDRPEPPASPLDQSKSALTTQEAVALCQQMTLQMNESLLRIVSDTEGENRPETVLMDGLRDILSKRAKEDPLLSTIRQDPSKTGLPLVQSPDRSVEKTGEIPRDISGLHEIGEIIRKASLTYGVDSGLIHGVIQAESDFNPDAISPKGAMGLMQLMPETAEELGVTDPLDPTENVMGGTRYLKKLLDRYDGSVPLALAAYNWGMGNLDSHRSRMPAETRNYVAKITGISMT